MPTASVSKRMSAPLGPLHVIREKHGTYELVGSITSNEGAPSFSYDPNYVTSPDAVSISTSLPLQEEAFSEDSTALFFDGILPEGSMRAYIARCTHLSEDDYLSLIEIFSNESAGALVFKTESAVYDQPGYRALDLNDLNSFAQRPEPIAFDLNGEARLSIAGAQSKIGVYGRKAGGSWKWFLPLGSAPSTHIIKAPSGRFPLQTINEAFCMEVAQACEFETAETSLIPTNSEPLLAVKRFDRTLPDEPKLVDGLPRPWRLHQEDFCQASGIPSFMKYEPTDGGYPALLARVASESSRNPFGDKMLLYQMLLFDFFIGNCDNHLKNFSMLWNQDWSAKTVAPLYDVTCTTFYPNLDREMGVALCPSRRIDDVSKDDVENVMKKMGVGKKMGQNLFRDLADQFNAALASVEEDIASQGFAEVSRIASFIRKDSASRLILV